MTGQAESSTSGQVGPKPKSTGKFKQDEERENFSFRLHREETDSRQEERTDAGEDTRREKSSDTREDARREEKHASKEKKSKQEKKQERTQTKAEYSAVRLEQARDRLAEQKPYKPPGPVKRAATAAGASVWAYGHRKIHEAEHENVGVEAAHKTELLGEAGAHKASRYTKRRIREHPARQVEKWERKTMKAGAELRYQQMAAEHPELQSNVLSRMAQKWKIKRQYAKEAREAARQGAKAAGTAASTTEKAAAWLAQFVRRHKSGAVIILLLFCLFLILNSVFSALPSLGTGMMNAVVGTSYTAEDEDILGANEDYTALENALKQKVANIERTHPDYDEYRYNVDELGHNPYELTSYLIAKLRHFTRENVQSELRDLFEAQYKLTLREEVQTRYYTDSDGDEHPYDYYILHVTLTNKTLPAVVPSRLNDEQKEIQFITVVSSLIFIFSRFGGTNIIRLFVDGTSEVYQIAADGFTIFSYSFLFCGLNIFTSSMFTALSNGKVSAILSFLRTFGLLAGGILLLPKICGLTGIWLAVPVAEGIMFLVSAACLLNYKEKYSY